MITRYRAWMDGQPLDGLAESIIIRDISETSPDVDIVTSAKPGSGGQHVLRAKRTALNVQVVLEIHEYSVARRQEVLDRVSAWCMGHILATSTRPGKRLHVMCSALPSVLSALRWTDEVYLTLTAYELPWWEDEFPTETRVNDAVGDERTLNIGGTNETALECSITCTGAATIDKVTVTAGSGMIGLEDVGLAHGETLHVAHDDAGRLVLRIEGDDPRTVYDRMTPESSDDLLVSPGPVRVTLTAGTEPVDVVWRHRARWR